MKVRRRVCSINRLMKTVEGAREYYNRCETVSFYRQNVVVGELIWEGNGKISRIPHGWLFEVEYGSGGWTPHGKRYVKGPRDRVPGAHAFVVAEDDLFMGRDVDPLTDRLEGEYIGEPGEWYYVAEYKRRY